MLQEINISPFVGAGERAKRSNELCELLQTDESIRNPNPGHSPDGPVNRELVAASVAFDESFRRIVEGIKASKGLFTRIQELPMYQPIAETPPILTKWRNLELKSKILKIKQSRRIQRAAQKPARVYVLSVTQERLAEKLASQEAPEDLAA